MTLYLCYVEYDLNANKCILWRVSYFYAEKTILLKADSNEKIDVHRKDLIKLLKRDLKIFRKRPNTVGFSLADTLTDDLLLDISSYVMKTLT